MRLNKYYKNILYSDIIWKQNLKNPFQVVKINKVALNTTSKNMVSDKKLIVASLLSLELITGQKLKRGVAKKSIAAFKIRKKQVISCQLTLRGLAMYCFIERMLDLLFPKIQGFEGVDICSIDSQGNLNMGLQILLVFPELENHFEDFEFISGFNLTIVTSFQNKITNSLLWSGLGFPEKNKI